MDTPPQHERRRPSLLSLGVLIALTAAFGGLLFLLFPDDRSVEEWMNTPHPDRVSLAYMQLLLEAKPNDTAVRLAYARQLAAVGEIPRAQAILAPLQNEPGEIGIGAEVFAAELAVKSGDQARAALSYERLAARDPPSGLRWTRAAIAAHLRAGDVDRAVALYQRLIEEERAARQFALAASDIALTIDVLRGADRTQEALALFERYAEDDRLIAGPLLDRGIALHLASGDVAAACPLAERRARARPDDRAAWDALARIAAWDQKPQLELEARTYLARRFRDDADRLRAERLGLQLYRPDIVLEMRIARSLGPGKGALDDRELTELVALFEALAEPEEAGRFLAAHAAEHPDRPAALALLAALDERTGDLSGAVEALNHLALRAGLSVEAETHRAELLWRTGDPGRALEIMKRREPRVGGCADEACKEGGFWDVYGALAWALEDDAGAEKAYRILAGSKEAMELADERLLELLLQQENYVEAVDVAERVYTAKRRSGSLLQAMSAAAAAGLWDRFAELDALAERDIERLGRHTYLFWLRAAAHRRLGKTADVARDLEAILALDPASDDAKIGLLWIYLDKKDRRALARGLDRWRSEARSNPALWAIYAQGSIALGRFKEAAAWLGKGLEAHQHDPRWLLDYADVLDKVGRKNSAWRLRRIAWAELRHDKASHGSGLAGPWSGKALPPRADGDPSPSGELEPRVAGAKDEVIYAIAAQHAASTKREVDAAMRDMLAKGGDDAERVAIAWFLTAGDDEAARRLLERRSRQNGDDRPLDGARLALALHDGDLSAVDRIISRPNANLPDLDAVEALRRLARDKEALSLAVIALAADPDRTDKEALIRAADQIIAEIPSSVSAEAGASRLDALTMKETGALGRMSGDDLAFAANLAYREIRSDRPSRLVSGRFDELDLGGAVRVREKRGFTELGIGDDLRLAGGAHLLYGALRQEYLFAGRVHLRGEALLNEIHDETDVLRALSARDRLTASGGLELFPRTTLGVEMSFARYHARSGELLGMGPSASFELAYHLIFGPEWVLRLTGAASLRSHAGAIPASLLPDLPAGSKIDSLLASEFAAVGLGTTLAEGRLGAAPGLLEQTRWFMNLWAGYLLPVSGIGYSAEAGLGVPVFGGDELSLRVYARNTAVTEASSERQGVEARYVVRLWP